MRLRSKRLVQFSDDLSLLARHALHSTVSIRGMTDGMAGVGQGSGWVFGSEGHIVTNHHVIDGLTGRIEIRPSGRPPIEGVVVGSDPRSDLAVLEVERSPALPLAVRVEPARLGELCLAIGAPVGLDESVSMGIVSGTGRQLPTEYGAPIEEVIQTDAAVNPGNSGGPLVDAEGRVIGVNTASRRGVENINFAVSAEVVLDVVPELIRFGAVRRASIGVSVANEWHQIGGVEQQFITVQDVRRDGCALRSGDVILQVNGQVIERRYDIRRALGRSQVGRTVKVLVRRDGSECWCDVEASPISD